MLKQNKPLLVMCKPSNTKIRKIKEIIKKNKEIFVYKPC